MTVEELRRKLNSLPVEYDKCELTFIDYGHMIYDICDLKHSMDGGASVTLHAVTELEDY